MRGCDYDVFVSYARSDGAAAAAELNSWLRDHGLRTFFDRSELRPGLPWVPALEEAINRCRAIARMFRPSVQPSFRRPSRSTVSRGDVSGLSSAYGIKTPTCFISLDCCACATSGHVMAEPATTLMKSRRRIAVPRLRTTPTVCMITAGICDRRNGVPGSGCTAAIVERECPLWVKGRHYGESA